MHLLTAASLKNRALIALVTIVAAVFGVLSAGSLKQELMPSIEFPAIVVVTNYPGASPEVVNNDVSEPIETALRSVPRLETTTATSTTGASMVLAEFEYGVDIPSTEQRVERAVSRISELLPSAADTQVMSGSLDDFPVIQVALTPAADVDPEETANLIERTVIPKLDDLDGVREATLSGARGDRVTITPNTSSLEERGLTHQSITDALQQSGVLMAAGTVTEEDGTLAVQAGSTLTSAEDIASIPIPLTPEQLAQAQQPTEPPGFAGQDQGFPGSPFDVPQPEPVEPPAPVTIGDLATVELEQNPIDGYSRVNGEPALTIGITKVSTANTVEVSHAVQDVLVEIEGSLDGAALHIIFDQAPYVEQSVETLATEGLLGLVFAVLVILVFLLSVRATLVTAISIPTSLLLTFIGLNFAEYTLNMLTLGALTISIGRVVDDSIVVIENIKRTLRPGDDRARTIIGAVREVAGAITSSTVATIVVFLPMAFVEGMVGELFRPFAFTASIALAASLFVSLTIVPVLAYWFLRPDKEHREQAADAAPAPAPEGAPHGSESREGAPGRENWLRRGYRPIITWTLKRPGVTLLIAALVFGGTVAMTPLMKTNFMGSDEQNSIGLTQTLTPGTSLDAQLAQAERVEEALSEVDAVETVQLTIGGSGTGMGAIFGSGGDSVINYSLTTDPDADQTEVQDRVRSAVEALDDAGEFSLGVSDGGVTMSSAIEVQVTGPDQESLAAASEALVTALQEQDGLHQVESDLGTSRPFLRVAVDRGAAAEVGLTEAAVASMVAQRMQPEAIGQITIDSTGVDVYLSYGDPPADVDGIRALSLPTAAGERRLDSLASVDVADGPVTVRTENAMRMVTVSALPEGDDLGTAGLAVDEALDSAELPAGTSASIGGVMAQQEEAFTQLGIALLVAILVVYVVMVATFRSLLQPFLLLVSVPFAATGAVLLLVVSGIPLGAASLIGVLMLIGIVVTNAIVLIDLVNQFRDRGDTLYDAVLDGSLQRLRPIVMTALATILALTPMGLGMTGKGGFISQPLAVVVIGGLFSSTVMTLIVLPTLYYIVERRREGGRGKRVRRRRLWPSGPKRNGVVRAGAAAAPAVALAAPAVVAPDDARSTEATEHPEPSQPEVSTDTAPITPVTSEIADAGDADTRAIPLPGPVAAPEHVKPDDPDDVDPVTGELQWDELMEQAREDAESADEAPDDPEVDPLWEALREEPSEDER